MEYLHPTFLPELRGKKPVNLNNFNHDVQQGSLCAPYLLHDVRPDPMNTRCGPPWYFREMRLLSLRRRHEVLLL